VRGTVCSHSRSDSRRMVHRRVASPELSATRAAVTRILIHMEHRDASLEELYKGFMLEYERLDHMTRVEKAEEEPKQSVYLPHHGVLREGSSTTRLRFVFNGSPRVNEGDSLNNHLLTGPNLLPPLADILPRWRRHRYAFVADIEKMYRQILVHPADRDL